MRTDPQSLEEKSRAFADEVEGLLDAVLPGQHRILSFKAVEAERYVIRPEARQIGLTVGGEELARLSMALYLTLDRHGHFLKTVKSDYRVYSVLDGNPLVRLEYSHDAHSAPICHWQVHAERGAMSHLLARAHAVRPKNVKSPHMLSSLHFPVGGERFRPALEDLLEFLIHDCGVDASKNWQNAIAEGRERWRRRQLRSVVRDDPYDAADVLQRLGWELTPPESSIQRRTDVFRTW